MKRLFLYVVMALSFGAFTLTSCDQDKEKSELNEEINRDGKDGGAVPSKFLPLSQQQAIFSQAVSGVSQTIDFSSMVRKMGVLFQETGYDVNWGNLIEVLGTQDEILEGKLNALKEFTNQEEISLDFEDLYFAADIKLIDSVFVDSLEYKRAIFFALYNGHPEEYLDSSFYNDYLIKDTVKYPVLMNIQHQTDRFRLNFHNGENTVAICLKCDGSSDGSVAIESVLQDSEKKRYIALPEISEFSFSLNGDTIISLNADLHTDFNVQAKRTLNPENGKFKLNDLLFDGNEINLNTSAKLDNCNLWAKANYDVENGLKVGFTASLYSNEVISGDINVKGVINNTTNWVEPLYIMAWAAGAENKFEGVNCNLNINKDLIKMHLSIDNPLVNPDALDLFTLLSFSNEQTPAPSDEKMNQIVGTINELIKGEIYFKGFEDPQAVLKVIYSPSTKVLLSNVNDVFKAIPENFKRFGLQFVFETYDAAGQKTFVTPKEYFGNINFKAAGEQIKNKFIEALGPVISTMFSKQEFEIVSSGIRERKLF